MLKCFFGRAGRHHCLNGVWGTLAIGLFATSSAPGSEIDGLFYGGGFRQLGLRFLGIGSVGIWTVVTVTIAFLAVKATIGLRQSRWLPPPGGGWHVQGFHCGKAVPV